MWTATTPIPSRAATAPKSCRGPGAFVQEPGPEPQGEEGLALDHEGRQPRREACVDAREEEAELRHEHAGGIGAELGPGDLGAGHEDGQGAARRRRSAAPPASTGGRPCRPQAMAT